MKRQNGPVILATLYTVGTVATICIAMLYARHGEAVARTLLAMVQIVVTGGAIFSAWALQSKKRTDDALDSANASADAALAVIQLIDKMASYPSQRAFEGKASKSGLRGHADIIEEEIKVLAALPLTALKPSEAAASLVNYRRFARQWLVFCRSKAEHKAEERSYELLVRLNDIRWAEYLLFDALGREIPERLQDLPAPTEVTQKLAKDITVPVRD